MNKNKIITTFLIILLMSSLAINLYLIHDRKVLLANIDSEFIINLSKSADGFSLDDENLGLEKYVEPISCLKSSVTLFPFTIYNEKNNSLGVSLYGLYIITRSNKDIVMKYHQNISNILERIRKNPEDAKAMQQLDDFIKKIQIIQ